MECPLYFLKVTFVEPIFLSYNIPYIASIARDIKKNYNRYSCCSSVAAYY